jgi:cardiolipin synthase A/B
MKYLFYTSSQEAWKGFRAAIESASSSIYIEMYIFIDDAPEARDLVSLLAQKAREGVTVKMVLDGFGSKELSSESLDILKNGGVEILFFNKLFRRLHRKIIIIDEKIGFVGGVNIHRSARRWIDLLIRVEGSVVYSLVRSFRKVYKACGGEDTYILNYKRKAILGRTRMWFLEHLPSIRRPRLKDSYKEAILQAQKTIIIATPYFLPHRWLKKLLIDTKERGVTIKVIVPKRTDISFITRANFTYMRLLSEHGIEFYLIPRMNHAKLLLVDDSLALVGSQNIDALSFDYNAEAGLFFNDPQMIKDLKIIIDTWKQESVPFDPLRKVTLFDRTYSYIIRLFQPFL